jgi:hypothetical protein
VEPGFWFSVRGAERGFAPRFLFEEQASSRILQEFVEKCFLRSSFPQRLEAAVG